MANVRVHFSLVYAIGAVPVAITMLVLFDSGVLGNDFAQMASVARNLLEGSGLQTDLIYYDVHYAMSAPVVPQTVFPPGQTLLVAPLMWIGFSSHASALTWSLVAFLASGWLLAATVSKLVGSNTISYLVIATWLVLAVNWTNVLACRSEILFIAMTVLSLYGFACWACGGQESRLLLLLLGAAAALAFLFRYQALFFIASIGLWFLGRVMKLRNVRSLIDLAAVLIIPGVVVLAILFYNFSVTGGMGGGPVDEARHSSEFWRVALGYYHEISKVLGISKGGLVRGGAAELFAIALVAYVMFALTRTSRQSHFWESESQRTVFVFCAIYLALSAIIFVYLSLTKSTGYTQARYLSTLLPFAILMLVLLSDRMRRLARMRRWQVHLGLALVVGFIGFGQARAISEQLDNLAADSRLREIGDALDSGNIGGQSIGIFLKSQIDDGNYLLANQSQLVGHVLNRPTFGLTPALYTSRVFDFEELRRMAADRGIRYVILFPPLYDEAAPQNANRIILTELANDRFPDWVVPVIKAPNVKLYRIELAPGRLDPVDEVSFPFE